MLFATNQNNSSQHTIEDSNNTNYPNKRENKRRPTKKKNKQWRKISMIDDEND